MKLDNFRTQVKPKIVQRGTDYYLSNHIINLEETETNFWQCSAIGTRSYDLEISLGTDNNHIEYWSCSCPYDHGDVCKHVVAALLTIEQHFINNQPKPTQTQNTNKKKRITKKDQLNTVLKKITRDELVEFIQERVTYDKALYDHLLLSFQHYTGQQKNPQQEYLKQCQTILYQNSDHGFIDYYAAYSFYQAIKKLIQQLAGSNFENLLVIRTFIRISEFLSREVAENMDDSDGHLTQLMQVISQNIHQRWLLLSSKEQTLIFEDAMIHAFDSDLDEYGFSDYFDELAQSWCYQDSQFKVDYIAASEERANRKPHYYAGQHLKLLERWGYTEEARAFADYHQDDGDCMQFLVDELINSDISTAITKLETLTQDQEAYPPYYIGGWEQQLISLYQQHNQPEKLEQLLQKRFLQSSDIERYHALKALYSQDDWKQKWQSFYQQAQLNNSYLSAANKLAILEEEQAHDMMLDILLSLGLSYYEKPLLHNYAPRLFPQHETAILEHYFNQLREDLKQASRRHYESAVESFQFIQQTPKGVQQVKTFAQSMCDTHPRRSAMIKLFKPFC